VATHRPGLRSALAAHRRVDDLLAAGGWHLEHPRDVWQLRRLGYPGNQTLEFTGMTQLWLRALAKRWLRWRLSTGVHLAVVGRGLRTLTWFAVFCDRTGVCDLADVDRAVIEAYLADLHTELAGASRHNAHIGIPPPDRTPFTLPAGCSNQGLVTWNPPCIW